MKRNLFFLFFILIFTACSTTPASPTTSAAALTLIPIATPLPIITPTAFPQPEQRIHEGDLALLAGDYDAALMVFQQVENNTKDASLLAAAMLGNARAQFGKKNYAETLSLLRTLTETHADDAEIARAWHLFGETFDILERYDEAIAAYTQYLQLKPGVIDFYVYQKIGQAHQAAGNLPEAITAYTAAIQSAHTTSHEALEIEIAQLTEANGDVDAALTMYLSIFNATTNPYSKSTLNYLIGSVYLAKGDAASAYARFNDSVENYPAGYDTFSQLLTLVQANVPVNEVNRGIINYNRGQYDLAIEAFNRHLAGNPTDPSPALYYKALATRQLGLLDYPFGSANRGEANLGNGVPQDQTAIELWQSLINTQPASSFFTSAWDEIIYTQWAYQGKPRSAAETALNFAAKYPNSAEAAGYLFTAGRNYERADELVKAAETWQRIASEYPTSSYAFQGLFLAGISYYRTADYQNSRLLFNKALVFSAAAEEQAAASLWLGKTSQAEGNQTEATDFWNQARQTDPNGYYGLRAADLVNQKFSLSQQFPVNYNINLAAERIDAETWLRTTFSLGAEINLESPGMLAADPRYIRGYELWHLGLYAEAKSELESLRQAVEMDASDTFRLLHSLVDLGLYRSAILASRQILTLAGMDDAAAMIAPVYFNHIRYGAYFLPWIQEAADNEGFSTMFLFSLIRQESLFEGFIESSAGAQGLMQIMPATGAQLATEMGFTDYSVADLTRPYFSITLGVEYLRRQLAYFDNDYYQMMAAYNGGPGNTLGWVELAQDDPDLFLEVIRIQETRTYLRRITEIFAIYRQLYEVK